MLRLYDILQEPHLQCAARRVELFHLLENICKDGLHEVLCFTLVLYDAECDADHEALIAIYNDCEGIVPVWKSTRGKARCQ